MNFSGIKTDSITVKAVIFTFSAVLAVFLGFVDRWFDVKTGTDLPFIIFFLIPVGITAWFTGKKTGLAISVLIAVTLFFADKLEIS